MTQNPEERRLRRLAASYNRDAAVHGQRYRVTWEDLALVEEASPFCAYCHIGLDFGQGTFDHAIPMDRRGPNAIYNLVRCCYRCQHEKGTKTPEEYAQYRQLIVTCPVDGTIFRPRWNEWKAGRGKLCSRRCAAIWRWRGKSAVSSR